MHDSAGSQCIEAGHGGWSSCTVPSCAPPSMAQIASKEARASKDMPPTQLIQPPPSTRFDALTRAQKLEILQEQLRGATEFVALSDEFERRTRSLAERLMQGQVALPPASRRAHELIAEAERELGVTLGTAAASSDDPEEQARQRAILLGRRLVAGARVARRDSRRYRWRVARRIAELEEEG